MTVHRVKALDKFQLISTSSEVQTLFPRVVVRYDDGGISEVFTGTRVTNATRSPQTKLFGNVARDGVVERAVVVSKTAAKRGRTYVELATKDGQEDTTQDILLQDYIASALQPSLDRFRESGPGGGTGFVDKRAIADDIAPVDIQHTLGESNLLRRIDGFIWYYHASGDVATRTLRVSLRDLGNGLPTGMTSGANTSIEFQPSAGALSLTQNEEGTIFISSQAGKDGYAASIDNGTLTKEATSTNPTPFPYWAAEDDVGELFFDVGSANANDRHSIYIIEEDWIYV